MLKKLDKAFVSEIDKFLEEMDQKIPDSASQLEEIAKFRRISALRDRPNSEQEEII